MNRSISVVIPNYNGAHLLQNNLPTVLNALKFSKVDYEIIIPDDHSKDSSVSFLKTTYPEVIVLESPVNLGFSGNINRGLRVAKKELVLILNSDVSLDEKYFESQFEYFNDKNLFGVMGAIYDSATKKIIPSNLYPSQSISGYISAISFDKYDFTYSLPICFLSGANTLVRRDMLSTLDYFNELFSPFYGEDIDLGFRAFRKGWPMIYDPKAICYHEGSSTINKFNKRNKIKVISRRNKYIFHEYHLSGFYLLMFHLTLVLDFMLRWLVLDFKFYKSFFMFLKLRNRVVEMKKNSSYRYSTQVALETIKHITSERVESCRQKA